MSMSTLSKQLCHLKPREHIQILIRMYIVYYEKERKKCGKSDFFNNYHQIHKREKMNTFFLFSTEGEKANYSMSCLFQAIIDQSYFRGKVYKKKKKKEKRLILRCCVHLKQIV